MLALRSQVELPALCSNPLPRYDHTVMPCYIKLLFCLYLPLSNTSNLVSLDFATLSIVSWLLACQKCCIAGDDQLRELYHKIYDQPRELRPTTRVTTNHESYDQPRELRPTMRAMVDHKILWLTMKAMSDHEIKRSLRCSLCTVIGAQANWLMLILLCPFSIHHLNIPCKQQLHVTQERSSKAMGGRQRWLMNHVSLTCPSC